MSITIRPAVDSELEAAAQLIATSFSSVEPTLKWYFPDKDDLYTATVPLARLWVEESHKEGTLIVASSAHGSLTLSPSLCGVAAWHQELSTKDCGLSQLKDMWQRVYPIMGFHTWRYLYEGWSARRARGVEPHCYLAALAVAEEFRGLGVARQLVTSSPCKNVVSALECREELLSFYERFGFQVRATYRLPRTATMYSLQRESIFSENC